MLGRRNGFNWAAPPDDGDADTAAADGESWLARQDRVRDWESVLTRMRAELTRICVSPLVRADPICRDILARLPEAADMEALDGAIGALRARVFALAEARGSPRLRPLPAPAAPPAHPRERKTFWI